MQSLYRQVAIVGIGETELGKLPGKTARRLEVEAIKLALNDAGLSKDDLDGVITFLSWRHEPESKASLVAEYLGIQTAFPLTVSWGGQSSTSLFLHAAMAISSGLAKTVVVVSADNVLSRQGAAGLARYPNPGGSMHMDYDYPYGLNLIGMLALIARRHMHEYGTTSEQLANVAVTFRNHALRHPKAMRRDPITIEDVLNSRMIGSPLHQLDYSSLSDGGWAVIMTSAERARDLRQKPVYLLGGAEAHQAMYLSSLPTLTTSGAVLSGEKAFQTSGVERKDIDVAFLGDPATIGPVILVEDLGFCNKGEGGAFVGGGRLAISGELPTNTHGGLLSYAHPGKGPGFPALVEMVLQLRGQAGPRQVKDAKLGLVHAVGGSFTSHVSLIWGN